MAVYQIIKVGDSILREKAKPVNKINSNILKLLDNMADTMYDAPGVGLAAPQIGVSKRVIIVDVGEGLVELINPELIEAQDTEIDFEGCLSVPGYRGEVARAGKITVKGLNREGKEITVQGEGLLARALQHELDHLDGILFIDIAQNVQPIE
ncbi:MAG: peptide deformylase [Bacillota bacterium]